MTFEMDREATLDHMAKAGLIDMEMGLITLYVCVCTGSDDSPHASHGGAVFSCAADAIRAAEHANRMAAEGAGLGCHYLASAVGMTTDDLVEVVLAVRGGGLE